MILTRFSFAAFGSGVASYILRSSSAAGFSSFPTQRTNWCPRSFISVEETLALEFFASDSVSLVPLNFRSDDRAVGQAHLRLPLLLAPPAFPICFSRVAF